MARLSLAPVAVLVLALPHVAQITATGPFPVVDSGNCTNVCVACGSSGNDLGTGVLLQALGTVPYSDGGVENDGLCERLVTASGPIEIGTGGVGGAAFRLRATLTGLLLLQAVNGPEDEASVFARVILDGGAAADLTFDLEQTTVGSTVVNQTQETLVCLAGGTHTIFVELHTRAGTLGVLGVPGDAVTDFSTAGSFLVEIDDTSATGGTVIQYNGMGINMDTWTGVALDPGPGCPTLGVNVPGKTLVVGCTTQLALTLGHPHGLGGPISVKFRSMCQDGLVAQSPLGGRMVQILIGGPLYAAVNGAHDGTNGAAVVTVPLDLSLVGLHYAAQALVVGGGHADLSSVLVGTVGTF